MAAHVASVRLKAFKSVGPEWMEVPLGRGLNAIVGEPRQGEGGGRGLAGSHEPALLLPSAPCFRLQPSLAHPCAGPNGCGKSSLLDALCFAGAAPPRSFPGGSLAGLASSDTSEVGAGRRRVGAARGGWRWRALESGGWVPDGGPHLTQRCCSRLAASHASKQLHHLAAPPRSARCLCRSTTAAPAAPTPCTPR